MFVSGASGGAAGWAFQNYFGSLRQSADPPENERNEGHEGTQKKEGTPPKKNTNNLKKNPNKDIGEYIDYEEID